MLYATFKTQVITGGNSASFFDVQAAIFFQNLIDIYTAGWYYIQAISDGGLAQLGERLPYKQRVGGSSPSASTIADLAQLVEQLTCNQ